MLYFAPRNKASMTFYAWMVELVDTTDLKSVDPKGRAGSSPAPGTKREIAAMRSPVFGLSIRIEHLIIPPVPIIRTCAIRRCQRCVQRVRELSR